MRTWLVVPSLVAIAASAAAQDAASLARAFEGTTVVALLDMPGTSEGVEIRPQREQPLDYPRLATAIKAYGIGIHRGESVMVTKVLVKGDHIEFQLGGGGYGTFGDLMANTPTNYAPYEYKSQREKDLEEDLKYTYDSRDRDQIKRELDDIEHQRSRDNAYAAGQNAQVQESAKDRERRMREKDGSRFNIKYSDGFPSGALTPDGIRRALGRYLQFDAETSAPPDDRQPPPPSGGSVAIHKGMTVVQIEQVLGPAAGVSQKTEGSMDVMVRDYATPDGQRVSARFVGGVLVDYTITPR